MKILKASDSAGKIPYLPSHGDLDRLLIREDMFKMSGDGVFHTIQGEGIRMGYPITFVRLHFCNLSCSWCDTYYTWQKSTKEYWQEPWDLPIKKLHSEIRKAQKKMGIGPKNHIFRVCFTGGEPLIQQKKIIRFIKLFPEYHVEIETNGTVMPDRYLLLRNEAGRLFFNCSPKLANSSNSPLTRLKPDVLKTLVRTKNPIFKFVCINPGDLGEIFKTYGKLIPRNLISIMPEGVTVEENMKNYKKLIPEILRLGLATQPRLQNIAFGGAKRRV